MCPSAFVALPAEPVTLAWKSTATSEVLAGNRPIPLRFDTAFGRTSLSPEAAQGLDLGRLELRIGSARAGPISAGLLVAPVAASGVLGSDLLHQLPVIFDARAEATELMPRFAAPSGAPVRLWAPRSCPGGHFAPLSVVDARLDGMPVSFVLDTGAEVTFVRSDVFDALSGRPVLDGIRVASGFAGVFAARATRARSLEIGQASAASSLVMSSPEVDRALDEISAQGLLGWSFLREFRVGLDSGRSSREERSLTLRRFEAQDHWTREFVGVGINSSRSDSPPGLRVDGFLSVSPARDAGLQAGDVIITVDGRPALRAPSPFAPAGSSVRLGVQRSGASLSFDVPVQDLLPDP